MTEPKANPIAADAASSVCEICGRERGDPNASYVIAPQYGSWLLCLASHGPGPLGLDTACYRLGYERLAAILEQYPCPHSRPSWRMCPHCLGINRPVPSGGWVADAAEPQEKKS